jgi:thiamine biosynthesis lipoprotein
MSVGRILWEVIQVALAAERWTDGLVTPTILPSLLQAGYDRTFDDLHIAPHPTETSQKTIEWSKVRIGLDSQTRSIYLPPGAGLDLGGVAKGWAADRAVERLAAFGPALVDIGGDIAVSGPQANGNDWPIAVASPLNPDEDLALLRMPQGGVATSGRDFRRWQQGGVWRHHIIDPRTGRPAETDVLSATVVASSALEAEIASKAALILGSQAGLTWLDARPTLAGLLVLANGQMLSSQRIQDYIWS